MGRERVQSDLGLGFQGGKEPIKNLFLLRLAWFPVLHRCQVNLSPTKKLSKCSFKLTQPIISFFFFPLTCPTLTSSSCSPPSSSPISAWRSAPCIAKTSSRPRFAKRQGGEWPPPEEEEEEEEWPPRPPPPAASTSRGRWRPIQPPPPDTRAGIAKASPTVQDIFENIFCQILGWLFVKRIRTCFRLLLLMFLTERGYESSDSIREQFPPLFHMLIVSHSFFPSTSTIFPHTWFKSSPLLLRPRLSAPSPFFPQVSRGVIRAEGGRGVCRG